MLNYIKRNLKDVIFPTVSVVAITIMYIFSAGKTAGAFENRITNLETTMKELKASDQMILDKIDEVKKILIEENLNGRTGKN